MSSDHSGVKTIYDVARKAGVSAATVSLVLNNKGRINAKTRERILRLVSQSDYVPSRVARQLRERKTYTIGVVISHFHNPFFTSMFDGIDALTERHGWSFLVAENREDYDREKREIRRMAAHGVDGLILFPCSQDHTYLVRLHIQYQMPVVLVGNYYYGRKFPAVVAANRKGARLATQRLVSLRRHPVLHVAGPQSQSMCRERKEGFLDALGSATERKRLEEYIVEMPDLSVSAGYRAMGLLQRRFSPPFSLFVVNDQVAFGVIKYCKESKLRIPKDVALIGFSDLSLIDDLDIGLSSVRIPAQDMGERAAEVLLECVLRGEKEFSQEHVELPVELVERRSSAW